MVSAYRVGPIKAGSINLLVCRVPIGTHHSAADNHRTAPSACTVIFISHPFGVIYRSPLKSECSSATKEKAFSSTSYHVAIRYETLITLSSNNECIARHIVHHSVNLSPPSGEDSGKNRRRKRVFPEKMVVLLHREKRHRPTVTLQAQPIQKRKQIKERKE